ncbi:MAG TPA: toxin-antitoxin system HicB family antitoxin [Gaiellaceae bacterium]|nr:toxin-antitoxin system HicB family antitoxin [Gaiellaceae bacterium]
MTAAPSATEQTKRGKKAAPSGRLLLRMPAALHAELAQTAEREGVSLNQFITRALAGRIGWGTDAEEDSAAPPPAATPADGRGRLIAVALVVNAVVIGLAAAAAIAVLVLAWRG